MQSTPSHKGLAYNLAEIIRLDNELRYYVRERNPFYLADIGHYRKLKDERRGHARVIENYRPK